MGSLTVIVLTTILLVLPCLAIKATEARARVDRRHRLIETGEALVNAVYDAIDHYTTLHTMDYCYTFSLASPTSNMAHLVSSTPALVHDLPTFEAAFNVVWPLAKARFEEDGYRIERFHLKDEDDAAAPFYQDHRDASGRIVRQERVCGNGAEFRSHYNTALDRCIQKARIVICWN